MFGARTPGSGGFVPVLSGEGTPAPGEIPALRVAGGLGGAPGAILVGVGPGSAVRTPALGGTVWVSPTWAFPVVLGGTAGVPGARRATLPVPLPRSPVFAGSGLTFQVLFADPGAAFGVSMTPGIEMWIG